MESYMVYIRKLSECQNNENHLRTDRETLIRKHERELEELDARLAAISAQRTQIIDDFKHFLDLPELLQQNGHFSALSGSGSGPPKLLRAESAEAKLSCSLVSSSSSQPCEASKPFQTLLTVDTADKSVSNGSSPSPTYHSASHSPNPQEDDSAPANEPSAPISDEANKVKVKSGRFKFVHRLAMSKSKSAGSVPSAITVASPTTTQIESMLFKVRENVHSLDDQTLNQCIDLLSSRILKDKVSNVNVLATPDLFPELKAFSEPVKHKAEVKEVAQVQRKQKVSKPAPLVVQQTKVIQQTESLPTSANGSPKQPSSPRKRIETEDERRRRIARVLQESSGRTLGSNLSRSTNSLNDLNLGSSKQSSLRPGRYGNRQNKASVRRNHSLSPLRFCQREKQMSAELEALLKEKEPKDTGEPMRRSRSDQNLDSDSVSMLSADDSDDNEAENIETDPADTEGAALNDDDPVDHLLAPSLVAKSQDLFAKVFFPTETTKPLLSKEELAKTRTGVLIKKQVKSLSQDSSRGSESPDSTGGSLRVDYLSHLRQNSASPEQRSRERELNSLNNSKKFGCYKDYWEKKTSEILDKQHNYSQWHQTNSVVGVTPKQPVQISRTQKAPSPPKEKKPQKLSKTRETSKPSSVISQGIERFGKPTNTPTVQTVQTAFSGRSNGTATTTSKKPEKASFTVAPKTENKQAPIKAQTEVKSPEKKSPSENFENDQLMQRLRHIQQDIRHRKNVQQGSQPAAVQQPQPPNQQARPSIQSAKSLDLQYYPANPLKQPLTTPKSAVVRIVQPNEKVGTNPGNAFKPIQHDTQMDTPGSHRNRMRLIRSVARDEPEEVAAAPVMTRPQQPRSMATNGTQRHSGEFANSHLNAFKPIQHKASPMVSVDSSIPMRSTYF